MKNCFKFQSITLCLLMAVFFLGCSDSGGGGGSSQSVLELSPANVTSQTGAYDGGISQTSTHTLKGELPNPGGDSTSYEGKAYLIVNGEKIQLNVLNPSANNISKKEFSKDGKDYVMKNGIAYPAGSKALSKTVRPRADGSITWQFEVTFSINAGPNTLGLEVFDLNDTLFARLDQWEVIGAIEPTNLVVTLSWDTNETDIDLHVADLEDTSIHCYYSNKVSGPLILDYDILHGYGPEHITLANAIGTKTYGIRVYYYADHNVDGNGDAVVPTTPTTATITARVNGETKISESHTMTSANTASDWGTGAHVWDVGELEVQGANIYTVTLAQPDLSAYPGVKLSLTVEDEAGEDVENLSSDNFYVVNAGTLMSPISVTDEGSGNYSLNYTDITAGARDLYVYVYHKKEDTVKGGLSPTVTYGKNYALLVGLNEYPPAATSVTNWDYTSSTTVDYIDVDVSRAATLSDFSGTLFSSTGTPAAKPVTFTAISTIDEEKFQYRLTMTRPVGYDDYNKLSVKYKKEAWLNNAVNDISDMQTVLTNNDNAWKNENITLLTNENATEAAVTAKIANIADDMEKYDSFIFMYSGHGSVDELPDGANDGNQYLCTYEDDNWISVTDLSDSLKDIKQPGGEITNLYVIIDACHSGNFIGAAAKNFTGDNQYSAVAPDRILKSRPFIPQADEIRERGKTFTQKDLQDMTNKANLFVMTAVTGDKSSWDDPDLENGVFAYYLLKGLGLVHSNNSMKAINTAPANSNKDVWITGEEAYIYADPLSIARVTEANGYPADAVEDPQLYDNSTSTLSRLIYNW